jgi:hypothetical protein
MTGRPQRSASMQVGNFCLCSLTGRYSNCIRMFQYSSPCKGHMMSHRSLCQGPLLPSLLVYFSILVYISLTLRKCTFVLQCTGFLQVLRLDPSLAGSGCNIEVRVLFRRIALASWDAIGTEIWRVLQCEIQELCTFFQSFQESFGTKLGSNPFHSKNSYKCRLALVWHELNSASCLASGLSSSEAAGRRPVVRRGWVAVSYLGYIFHDLLSFSHSCKFEASF